MSGTLSSVLCLIVNDINVINNKGLHTMKNERMRAVTMVKDCMNQSDLRKNKELYLPVPSGLKTKIAANDSGSLLAGAMYEDYGNKGRVPNTVRETYNSIMGMTFKNAPSIQDSFVGVPVTSNGLDTSFLLKETFSNVLMSGYVALVVSSEYESLIFIDAADLFDIEHDKKGDLIKVAIHTEYGEYHYEKSEEGIITLHEQQKNSDTVVTELNFDFIPVTLINSTNSGGEWFDVPLQYVAECIVSYYQLSCESRRALSDSVDPTLVSKGVETEELDAAFQQGKGYGSAWGSVTGEFYYLESTGGGVDKVVLAMDKELQQAESQSMKLISTGNARESEEAIRIRRASQTQSVNTIADNVTQGVLKALDMLYQYRYLSISPNHDEFSINIDDSSLFSTIQYGDVLLRLIQLGKAPDEVIFNYLKNTGALTGTGINTVEEYQSKMTNSGEI